MGLLSDAEPDAPGGGAEHGRWVACALGEARRKTTRMINCRQGQRGHLWQERFHSFVMDEPNLFAAAHSIERNPVRAGFCRTVEHWPWSSARAHLRDADDELVRVRPLFDLIPDWAGYLADPDADRFADRLHRHARTGRPLGADACIQPVEAPLGRVLRPRKPGPMPRSRDIRTGDMLADVDEA